MTAPTHPRLTARERARVNAEVARQDRTRAAAAVSAAATPAKPNDKGRFKLRKREAWQEDVYAYFDSVPELKYATLYVLNAFSKLRLVPAVTVDPDEVPVAIDAKGTPLSATEQEQVQVEFARLKSARGGQSRITSRLGAQLFLVGECHLVGKPAAQPDAEAAGVEPAGRPEQWDVLSINELEEKSGKLWEVGGKPDGGNLQLTGAGGIGALVVRIHQEHLSQRDRPDSSVNGVLDAMEELAILCRVVRATGKSRIAQSSIIGVPHELSPPPHDPDTGEVNGPSPLAAQLMEHFITPIGDEGSASAAAPFLVEGPAEYLKAMKDSVIELTRPLDEVMTTQRQELRVTIATGIDLPPEILTGVADVNHWCVDDSTEVLTRDRGWITQDQLASGDVIRTLNHDSGLAEWQPVLDLYRAAVVDEPMRLLQSRTHSSMSTLNHRWPVLRDGKRVWLTSETLGATASVLTTAPSGDLPTTAKYDDALVELAGWFWTEGHVIPGGGASIAQSHTANPDRVVSIRRALTALYGPASPTLRRQPAPAWRESVQSNASSHGGPVTVFHLNVEAAAPLLHAAPGKILSAQFVDDLTLAQLHLLIDTSCQGDGWHYRSGRLDIWQKNPAALDGFERALHLAGYATSRHPDSDGTVVTAMRSVTTRPVKAARESIRVGSAGATDAVVPYTGVLWCPVTPNGTWFARRDGRSYFTGNTAWQVSEETFKAHLEPRAITVVEALTIGWLRAALMVPVSAGGPGWSQDRADLVQVWYDASRLVAKPNREASADTAHDRMVISDEAYRQAKGFTGDDAPDAEEIVRRIAAKRTQFDGALSEPFLRLLLEDLVVRRVVPAGQAVAVSDETGVELQEPAVPGDAAAMDSPAGGSEDGTSPAGDDGQGTPGTVPPSQQTVTAAAAAARRGEVLSRRLVDIDRDLRARLEQECDLAMGAALLRAGNRLANVAQKRGQEARQVVAATARPLLASALGRPVVAALGVTDDELLADAFAELGIRFDELTTSAQEQVLEELTVILGLDLATMETVRARQTEARATGAALLVDGMLAIAKQRLYDPNPQAPADGETLTATVPVALVRAATAAAGGQSSSPLPEVQTAHVEVRGGVGTGGTVTDLLSAHGGKVTSFEWVYGISRNRFKGHVQLTGVRFKAFDDPVLANPHDFPPEPFYRPGDHDGCRCDAYPVWMLKEDDQFHPQSGADKPSDLDVANAREAARKAS